MEKDIGKIKKNDITDIVVRIDDFGGKKGLTIREIAKSLNVSPSAVHKILAKNFSGQQVLSTRH